MKIKKKHEKVHCEKNSTERNHLESDKKFDNDELCLDLQNSQRWNFFVDDQSHISLITGQQSLRRNFITSRLTLNMCVVTQFCLPCKNSKLKLFVVNFLMIKQNEAFRPC